MATLGRREMSKKSRPNPLEAPAVGIAVPAVNLGTIPTKVEPVTTLGIQPPVVGSPIMREDFITTTGFMLPRID
jgi:hypothetical protein